MSFNRLTAAINIESALAKFYSSTWCRWLNEIFYLENRLWSTTIAMIRRGRLRKKLPASSWDYKYNHNNNSIAACTISFLCPIVHWLSLFLMFTYETLPLCLSNQPNTGLNMTKNATVHNSNNNNRELTILCRCGNRGIMYSIMSTIFNLNVYLYTFTLNSSYHSNGHSWPAYIHTQIYKVQDTTNLR